MYIQTRCTKTTTVAQPLPGVVGHLLELQRQRQGLASLLRAAAGLRLGSALARKSSERNMAIYHHNMQDSNIVWYGRAE